MKARWGPALVGACALLVLGACTAEPASSPREPAGRSTGLSAGTGGQGAGPDEQQPTGDRRRSTQPLVLAVHPRRPRVVISPRVARDLVAGRVTNWRALGQPTGPLRVVRGGDLRSLRRDTVAVVPARRVGPEVRAIEVGGTHPMREPAGYPLQVAGPEPSDVTTVTLVGDVMLGRRVADRAAVEGDPAYALRPMQRRLASADITVGNLESTLSRAGPPTQGDDSFAADPRVRAGLRDAGFDALSLANNHLGDFGPVALTDTVRLLRDGGIRTFGAGRDAAQAWEPVVLERGATTVGFLGFNAIGETPEVGPRTPGAVSVSMPPRTGPLDRAELDRFLRSVRRLDRSVDVTVVLPHWGTQYTQRPEPVQRSVAGELVRAGADLVVGGHPHWVQGAGLRGDALVVHSLGNFVFDMDFMSQTMEGLVLEAVFWGDELVAAELVPHRMGPDFAPRVVPHAQAGSILDLFWEFSSLGASSR